MQLLIYAQTTRLSQRICGGVSICFVWACKEPETRKVIQKGKALEILIQVLEQADRDAAFSRPLLNKKDTEKIYTAKEWLDKHSSVSVTLFKLARGSDECA